ncbi:hypothetical protein [Methylomonas rhizoryzae]|uniref:hypothetical protein n=1 Tax=Methylomonas rhizoryzae TaxID=2608981 RepID=UPI0012319468|nr:hypothetical protein [Methylomonas rhizoryzae]
MAAENFTQNQATRSISAREMRLIDAITLKTERARCVLELVLDASSDNNLVPVISVAIDEIAGVNSVINAWMNKEVTQAEPGNAGAPSSHCSGE